MTDTDTCGDDTPQDDNTCPVCGQEYIHKREEHTKYVTNTLRGDYRECRIERTGALSDKKPDTVYVHEPGTRAVSHVKKDTESGASNGFRRLNGGGS